MLLLVLGLLLFLGVHSTRIVADGWRTATIARIGAMPWKAIYAVLSIAGFALLAWGYGLARQQPVVLWSPPAFTRHVTALLMLPVFVMFVAAYVPGNGIKAKLKHPQILSVKLWAVAHLLSNGTLADVVLFGSLLVWAVLDFKASKQRERTAQQAVEDPWNAKTGFYSLEGEKVKGGPAPLGTAPGNGGVKGTVICVVTGLVIYAAFVMGLHQWLIGVRPF
jgi:uncharacterized membrane protein